MTPTLHGDETRERLLEYVANEPGAHLQEVQTALGIGWGTVVYQVDRLEARGHLRRHKYRGEVGLFSPDLNDQEVRWLAALRARHATDVIAALDENGAIVFFDVAKGLNVTQKVIRTTVKHLEHADILERHHGRPLRFTLAHRFDAWRQSKAKIWRLMAERRAKGR